MNAVFDPSILFISNTDWVIEEKRDLFLQQLLSIIKGIGNRNDIKIYWDNELESYLWGYPQLPPWRTDKTFKNQIIPKLYYLFSTNFDYIEFQNNLSPCFVNPNMVYNLENEGIFPSFLKLMHEIINRKEDVFLCTGCENNEENYIFSCSCHENCLNPYIIRNEDDFTKYIDLENDLWPKCKDDIDKLINAIAITRKLLYNAKEFKYKYTFSNDFIEDIIMVRKRRLIILKQITKRLILSRQEATADVSLQDEYIKKSKEYRIRVTQRPASIRIHYRYKNNSEIEFLKLYDEGHHDDAI